MAVVTLLVGRQGELAALGEELAASAAGAARLVVVEGEAGMGKTALLGSFCSGLRGVDLRRAVGEQAEQRVPYGVLDQLWPGLGLGAAAAVPSVPDAGAALLAGLWADGSRSSTLAVVLDDAHWADEQSIQAMLFAVRRMAVEPALVVLARRPQQPDGALAAADRLLGLGRGRVVRVGPLDAAAVRELSRLTTGVALSPAASRRLCEHTGGSPLYAAALLRELPAGTLEDLRRPLPAPRSFLDLVGRSLERCREETRRLVGAMAVLGTETAAGVVGGVAGVGDVVGAVDEAVSAGLIVHGTNWVLSFAHPLVRQAAYDRLSGAERAGLHRLAADRAPDERSRLQHRVAATPGPDPALAAELAEYGRRAAAQQAATVAAAAFHDAHAFSSPPAESLLLDCAEQLLLAGRVEAATTTLAATSLPGARRSYLLGWAVTATGDFDAGDALLREAWATADPDSPLRGLAALQLARVANVRGRSADAVLWGERSWRSGTPEHPMSCGQLVAGLLGEGRIDGARDVLAEAVAASGGALRLVEDSYARGLLGWAAGDLAEAEAALVKVLELTALHPFSEDALAALGPLSEIRYQLGDWDQSLVDGQLAVSRSEDAGAAWLTGTLRAVASCTLSRRGEWLAAEAEIRAAELNGQALSNVATIFATAAGARLAHTRDDYERVVQLTEHLQVSSVEYASRPGFFDWRQLRVESLVRLRRLDQARREGDELRARAEEAGHRGAVAACDRNLALWLAARGDQGGADAAYRAAVGVGTQVPMPFELALTRLYYGEHLAATGRRSDAAAELRAALETFDRLRAAPYVARAERALASCGRRVAARDRAPHARLTPQELAVARLVSTGLTNKAVAAELVVSVKTVEYHLAHAFAKVGARNRTELARLLTTAAPLLA